MEYLVGLFGIKPLTVIMAVMTTSLSWFLLSKLIAIVKRGPSAGASSESLMILHNASWYMTITALKFGCVAAILASVLSIVVVFTN